MVKGKKIIIHDLPEEKANLLFSKLNDDYIIYNALKPAVKCIGCFECWLKKPGVCKFPDKLEYAGSNILSSKQFIIISEILYGGVSIPVKKILDRSIPGITPFFKKRFGELHHYRRFKTETEIKTYFYNTKNISKEEKDQAKEYIDAMGINYYSKHNDVFYIDDMDFSEVNL